MKYKKQTISILILTAAMIILLTGCGIILRPAGKADVSSNSTKGEGFTNKKEDRISEDDFHWYGETSLIPEEMNLPNTMINSEDAMNHFLESDDTIALLASLTKEDIYVYGLKENSGSKDDFSYWLHGLCIRQGNEIEVLDIDWGIYGDIPQIEYKDFDGNGQKELAMIFRSVQGTGLSLVDLHILKKSEEGGWKDNHFSDWADQLKQLITSKIENGILKLYFKEEQFEEVDLSALEEEWNDKCKEITFGNNVNFLFKDGKIFLQVTPMVTVGDWVTPQEFTNSVIQMEVHYNGGFELSEESFCYLEAEPADINPEINSDIISDEKVEGVISNNYNSVFEGIIGTKKICMAIYRDGEKLTSSYITQNEEDGEINLLGTIQINTASFVLHSEDNDITFIGAIKPDTEEGELLEGTYTSSENEEKAAFTMALSHTIGSTYETRYPFTPSNTEAVEEFAGRIKSYILENNKTELVQLIDYPISVFIDGSKVTINNSKEFEQNYDDIMNADIKDQISNSYTKYMNSNSMGIMLGYGCIWFDNRYHKGLRIYAINN